MRVEDVLVALDWTDECHGIKVRWPGRSVVLLSDDGNDFYPSEDARDEEWAEAELRMDAVSACAVSRMAVKDGYLVIELEPGAYPSI